MTKSSKLLLSYENKWVALTPKGDKVLASAKDPKRLSEKLESLKIKRDKAVMTFVPSFKGWYSPFNV